MRSFLFLFFLHCIVRPRTNSPGRPQLFIPSRFSQLPFRPNCNDKKKRGICMPTLCTLASTHTFYAPHSINGIDLSDFIWVHRYVLRSQKEQVLFSECPLGTTRGKDLAEWVGGHLHRVQSKISSPDPPHQVNSLSGHPLCLVVWRSGSTDTQLHAHYTRAPST